MIADTSLKTLMINIGREGAQRAFDTLCAIGSADPDNFRRDVRIATINNYLMSTSEPVRRVALERGITSSEEIHAVWIEAAQAFSACLRELEGIPADYEPEWTDEDKALQVRLHCEAKDLARLAFQADCIRPADVPESERLAGLNASFARLVDEVAIAINPRRPAEEAVVDFWIRDAWNVLAQEYIRLRDAWASDEGGRA